MKHKGKLVLAAVLALALCAGATAAWMTAASRQTQNTFLPAEVTCQVEEAFSGREKTSVTVRNTGNISAFLRLRLVTYRVNEKGERIGGTAEIPPLSPGEGWLAGADGCYYYVRPVAPNELTGNLLARALPLTAYADADGGVQVIEVVAEAIQSVPAEAVSRAWPAVAWADGALVLQPGEESGT